jgi:hypothetical protein
MSPGLAGNIASIDNTRELFQVVLDCPHTELQRVLQCCRIVSINSKRSYSDVAGLPP